jgi:DNA-binding transcriptional ArsR family regulator
MQQTLFQKDVSVKRVTTLGHSEARALNDPVRIRILEILSHKQMSAEEIARALGSSGYKKATTTIRHHLDTLKRARLVEATKMVEVRGAVMKYYSPTLRVFSYGTPADLEKHARLIEDTSSRLLKVLKSVFQDKKFLMTLNEKHSCGLCKNDHFREYLALEILNAAVARAMGRKEYSDMATAKEQAKK